jgi:hypothetical protein
MAASPAGGVLPLTIPARSEWWPWAGIGLLVGGYLVYRHMRPRLGIDGKMSPLASG